MNRYDAVIAGAGAAGLGVATCAAAMGAHVLLIDRTDGSSSDFSKSGGGVAAAGTVFQEAAGVVDSAAIWIEDIRRKTNNFFEPSITKLVTRRARDAIRFQAQQLGMDLHLVKSIPVAGHSAQRLHGTLGEDGREYFEILAAAADRLPGITRLNDAEATGLIASDEGVAGLIVRVAGGEQRFEAPYTVLCCGGFAANRTMVRQHIPEIAAAPHIGCPYNDGRGIVWGQALGAAASHLDSYQGHGHVTADGKGRLGLGLTTLGAIMVDCNGRRFVREDIGPSELAAHVMATPGGSAIEVYDQQVHEAASSMGAYRNAVARGIAITALTPEALAERLGIAAGPFAATLSIANRAAAGEVADPLGREKFGRTLSPPLWGVRVTGALAHTQGGLLINDQAGVLSAGGFPIKGLLAAGGTVAGISGRGAAGYSSGNGLAQAFALGMIAAETISSRTVTR